MHFIRFIITLITILITQLEARDRIQIMGSSTIYPFATTVAEEYAALSHKKTPLVEAIGSGSGIKLLCQKDRLNAPDIANASRRMKLSELQMCHNQGVKNILEIVIGFDGIVIAQSKENAVFSITKEQLALALLAKVPSPKENRLIANAYLNWSDINSTLGNRKIIIYGPPTSSGTREMIEKMILHPYCAQNPLYRNRNECTMRKDNAYIPSGENDNIIVQKLQNDSHAFGVFGFNFLIENEDKIQGIVLDGIEANTQSIAKGEYPIVRKLYFYLDMDRFGTTDGLEQYAKLFVSEYILSKDGLLGDIGLVTLLDDEFKAMQKRLKVRQRLTLEDLK
ncbi:MAG: substrate-binding domain-containing protein [Campylobacterales bacterium]|nr:substrate-binding domain-containing protein [Campylobacterales bacterium]